MPPERFGEPARHFGVDLPALAEERPQRAEGVRHAAAECRQHEDRDGRQVPVQPEQHAQPQHRGDEAADELHQARADEIPDAFGVGHDARDQHAGLRRVEVADRQAHDVRLDALAHVGDRALRRDAEDLRQRERRHRLHERGRPRRPARWAAADRHGSFQPRRR